MSHNKIPEQPVLVNLIEAMRMNESLINIDLSSNPGCTKTVKHQLALCLLKNMDILKNASIPIKATWLDPKQIEVLDEQLNEFLQGFSFVEEASFMSKDGNREVQLLNAIRGDQSFQARMPNLKRDNAHKSNTSVLSRGSHKSQTKVTVKARMDVSGDRSIDMFASEFNSATGH